MAEWKEHLSRAVRQFGSQQKLASALGWSQSKISWLLVSADKIAGEDALHVHRVCQGQVTASQLRPDLWPTEQHVPIEPNCPVAPDAPEASPSRAEGVT